MKLNTQGPIFEHEKWVRSQRKESNLNSTKNPQKIQAPAQIFSPTYTAYLPKTQHLGKTFAVWLMSPSRTDYHQGKSPFPQLSVNDNGHTDRCRNESPSFPYILSITSCLEDDEKFIRGLPPGFVGRRFRPEVYNYIQRLNYRPSGMLPLLVMRVPFKHSTLSSPREDRYSTCTMMVLAGFQKSAVVFCDLNGGNYAWLKHDSTLVDPHSSNQQHMKFTNAIGFKGKFYALSLQGTLAVIEKIDSHFRITSLGTNRAVPSVHSMHFKEYLIESNGEILLVFLVSRKSIHRVENVEVYRLQPDKLSWVKMESIGDRTLFVGTNWYISVDASKIGCRVDCVYFCCETVDEWWVYDMESGSISPGWKNCDTTSKSSNVG